jgi:uncharacterized protein (DUF58 family)
MPISSRLLSPHDREALSSLQILARGVVDGVTGGRHRSSHQGSSVEFKEHRQYVKGDEVRSIDWKLFGKTDRLFIRQYEDETNLRAMILLDQSGSMAYGGSRSDGLTKHEYGKRLAACLATLLISQQDAVGVCTFDTQIRELVPPRSQTNHLQAVGQCLVSSATGGETQLSGVLKEVAARITRRSLLILISDCFDDVEQLISALSYFRHHGSEVVIFQVWDQDELDFPFRRRTQFRNLENATHQRLVDPNAIRREYLQRVSDFRQQLALQTARDRIDLISCVTTEAYTQMLTDYMAVREGHLPVSRLPGSQRDVR